MMIKLSVGLLLLGLALPSAAAEPGSCLGRCGEVFTRGQQCTCDFSCLQHNECCQDFEAACTAAQSCQGRCDESFKRGQLCECDPLCVRYNTCCHDYQLHCDARVSVPQPALYQSLRAAASGNRKPVRSKKSSNSESEEWYTGSSNIPAGLLPVLSSPDEAPHSTVPGSSLPSRSTASLGSSALANPSAPGAAGGPSGPAGSRPSTLQDVAQALGLSAGEAGAGRPQTGLFADVDLCSDSPISGLTALRNGTVLIFKGELFWSVDPVSRLVGRPQRITDTLGVLSPIDTVFTRCNCHGNIYIIKGDQYWRLDGNMVMKPGYPKPLASEFPGLTRGISAALAVPATRTRPESVYFFKKGDIMQRFTFPAGNTPSCSRTPRGSLKRHFAHQTDVLLSKEINIKVSLKGVPTPVTSALSMLSHLETDRYQHFIFSGPLFFSVQISGDLPVLAEPDSSAALAAPPILNPAVVATSYASMVAQKPHPPHPPNSIRLWLRCP